MLKTIKEHLEQLTSKLRTGKFVERRRDFNRERAHRHPALMKAARRSKLKRRN